MQVHVVTFEGEGSGGFNWFYKEEMAHANYDECILDYSFFDEKTTITYFVAEIPDEIGNIKDISERQKAITEFLARNDVYGMSDAATKRIVVGKET